MVFSGACLRSFNEVRRVFKFFHKISNFRLIFASKFQIKLVKVSYLFIFFSTLIFYGLVEEQQLFDRYLFAVAMGELGVYDSLSPTEKTLCLPQVPLGGAVWVSNGLIVWSVLTLVVVVCRLTVLFFSPEGILCPAFR